MSGSSCPNCDGIEIRSITRSFFQEYGIEERVTIAVSIPVFHCAGCGLVYSGVEGEKATQDTIDKYRRVFGAKSPESDTGCANVTLPQSLPSISDVENEEDYSARLRANGVDGVESLTIARQAYLLRCLRDATTLAELKPIIQRLLIVTGRLP